LEFEQGVEELRAARDASLRCALLSQNEHLLRHFGAEERCLQEYAYPVMDCHKREHDTVFEVMNQLCQRCTNSD